MDWRDALCEILVAVLLISATTVQAKGGGGSPGGFGGGRSGPIGGSAMGRGYGGGSKPYSPPPRPVTQGTVPKADVQRPPQQFTPSRPAAAPAPSTSMTDWFTNPLHGFWNPVNMWYWLWHPAQPACKENGKECRR